jgi:hypothetical protein
MIVFVLCGVSANVAIWKMTSEVNARLANDQKFALWWWNFGKYIRIWKEHKRLYPKSRWRLYSVLSYLASLALMILTFLSVARQGM